MVPDAPTLIMDLTVSESSLHKVFDACNNFPKSHSKVPALEMELKKFHKLLRDLDLLGPKLTTLDVDFILLKARPRGARKLSLKHFGVAVELVAEKVGIHAADIINKAIELGCPLPSAPPRPEWKQLSPQLMAKTGHVRSDRIKCVQQRWKKDSTGSPSPAVRGTPGSSPAEQRMLSQSAEWAGLREQREAMRARYAAQSEGCSMSASKAGSGRNRSTSLTAGSAGNLNRRAVVSDGKIGGRGSRTRSVTADRSPPTIPENPLEGDGMLAEPGKEHSPHTPFAITHTDSSPSSGLGSSSFQTPPSGRSDTSKEEQLDLFSAFVVFSTISPHKENEPKMSKLHPLMNMTEFRRLCRECDLAPSAGSEQPDITFHIVSTRMKSKYLDFDAFLCALERVALATHLNFTDMECRITQAAETLKAEGGHVML